jgi:WD40 repeat protein/serine/threonine protein kinase
MPRTHVVSHLASIVNSALPIDHWPQIPGYEILSVIGSGGMGIVYKARHRDLNRVVALKMLLGSALTDLELRDRFRSEAEAVAKLQHPNIIQVFEIGSIVPAPGSIPSPFIALEFVDGGALTSQTLKPQNPRHAAQTVLKLARAAHAIHEIGIIHRDLKPANVLLTNAGEPKIADFGLAKQLAPVSDFHGRFVTQTGTALGTPEYMPPEQAMGQAPAPTMDVYALGVILYEMLTAHVPFEAATPLETVNLACEQEPVSPRQLQPAIPRDLETVCLKCLEKDAARRYNSAAAMADDLQRFLDDRPIHARRTNELEKMRRWCRRNPLSAASLGLVVTIFLAAFALVTDSYFEADRARQDVLNRAKSERWERYRALIAASDSAMLDFNVTNAHRNLDGAPLEFRNWEWFHLRSRVDLAQQVIANDDWDLGLQYNNCGSQWILGSDPRGVIHFTNVNDHSIEKTIKPRDGWSALFVSSDDKTMIFATPDKGYALCDIESGNVRGIIGGGDLKLDTCFMTRGDDSLFTNSLDGIIREWSLKTGHLLRSIRCEGAGCTRFCVTPDKRHMAYIDDECRTVRIYDLESGRPFATLGDHHERVFAAVFSPDSKRIVTTDGFPANTVRFWDVRTGRLIRELGRHKNVITCIAYSHDGGRIASASRDQSIRLWDGITGQPIATLHGHRGCVRRVTFSPDGTRLASASEDGTLRLWEAETGNLIAVLNGHSGDVNGVGYSADGQFLVSVASDRTVRIWNPAQIESNGRLRGHTSFVYGVAFHPNNERVATASWDGTARIWDATTGREIQTLVHPKQAIVTSVAFHPEGKMLATRARDAIRLWDAESGRMIRSWPAPSSGWHDTNLAFSHRGHLLATGGFGYDIQIWNVENGDEVATLAGHVCEVRDVVFSPDDRFLVSGADDGDCTVRIWDVKTMQPVWALGGHSQGVFVVAFSRDGSRLASGSLDGTVRIWDTTNWSEVAVLRHASRVYGVAFNLDGSRLACACSDNLIHFWDTATHQEVADLRGHSAYVFRIAFSPDGSRLISGSGDGTARIWDRVLPQDRVSKAEAHRAGNRGP